MSFSLIVFYILLCRFETMAGWNRRSCTIQRQRSLEVEGSVPQCNVKRPQGWTEWIQPRSQPRRHKEGRKRLV